MVISQCPLVFLEVYRVLTVIFTLLGEQYGLLSATSGNAFFGDAIDRNGY